MKRGSVVEVVDGYEGALTDLILALYATLLWSSWVAGMILTLNFLYHQ